jgi:hypothetical protein
MPAEVTWMAKRGDALMVPCMRCGNRVDPVSGVTVWHSKASAIPADVRKSDSDLTEFVCLTCYWAAGRKPVPAAPAPKPLPPITDNFARTVWPTLAEAEQRRNVVMHYLGVQPQITPSDPSMPGPFTVCPDSPLCPGFDKAKK